MFDLHQYIQLLTEKDAEVVCISTLEDLGENIANICNERNIYEVHLYGNKEYSEKIIEDIHFTNKTKYSNNKEILIEVN